MKKQLRLVSLFTLVLAPVLVAVVAPAQAAALSTHSLLNIHADGGSGQRPTVRSESVFGDDTGELVDIARDGEEPHDVVLRAKVRARSSPGNISAFLRTYAYASNDFERASLAVYADASAAWRDVAMPLGGSTPPWIKLHFGVHTILDGFGGARSSALSINASTNVENDWLSGWDQYGSVQLWGPGYDSTPPYEAKMEVSGWDSSEADPQSFTGLFHLVVPYNASLGGYPWGVSMTAHAYASRGRDDAGKNVWATVNAFNSMGIVQVTDPNGIPIAVAYESGLGTVPEPASILLLLAGLFGFTGIARNFPNLR